MTSNYNSMETDLDSMFELLSNFPSITEKAPLQGFEVNGVDISERYVILSYGSASTNSGYEVNGVDLSSVFAAKGTVSLGPSQVTGLRRTGTSTSSVSLSWNATSGATMYEVEYSTSSTSGFIAKTTTHTSTSYTVTGLSYDSGYYFRVRASDGNNRGEYSPLLYAITDTPDNRVSISLSRADFGSTRGYYIKGVWYNTVYDRDWSDADIVSYFHLTGPGGVDESWTSNARGGDWSRTIGPTWPGDGVYTVTVDGIGPYDNLTDTTSRSFSDPT